MHMHNYSYAFYKAVQYKFRQQHKMAGIQYCVNLDTVSVRESIRASTMSIWRINAGYPLSHLILHDCHNILHAKICNFLLSALF